MPDIQPIPAIQFSQALAGGDVSALIAPPYDVLDAQSKADLVSRSPHNIVVVDLPHLPAKTVGPDETYVKAGRTFQNWLEAGVIAHRERPALFVYQQTFTHPATGKTIARRGVFANVKIQPFGPAPDGRGGVHPHEKTFPGAKEDRLKLMKTTRTQLSPIFGLYSDAAGEVGTLIQAVIDARDGQAPVWGVTAGDGVRHDLWPVEDHATIHAFQRVWRDADLFIADGHHRYTTALNYHEQMTAQGQAHPQADYCLFVLVALQDPGMIVLPTHRVLGGLDDFTFDKFIDAARGKLHVKPFDGTDLKALEAALPGAGAGAGGHAIGLVVRSPSAPGGLQLAIATTVQADPLQATHPDASDAWRSLDVAIVQHLIVERIVQPAFCPGPEAAWKFPHELGQLQQFIMSGEYQLGLVLQPTPLDSVRKVSEAGELMPQKSTFFYPKLATGLVLNPLA